MEVMKLLTVFGLGAVSLSTAILTGLALGLPPAIAGIMAAAGSLLGAWLVAFLGEGVRTRLLQWRGGKDKVKRQGSLSRLWSRYGVAGLGLLIPLLFNTPLGTALAITMGVPVRRLMLWLSFGIILWSIIVTTAGALGLVGLQSLGH